MPSAPLMPKATAVWLVDNTALTFRQIADFCVLHELEIKGIADGDVAQGIKGLDPIASGQLSREEMDKAQNDSSYRMKLLEPKFDVPVSKTMKGPKYTPLSRRQDRPDAIAWLLRNHPELSDGQIMKLVGTTKPTIQSIRDRSHWNSSNIKPVDPVSLSLCSQVDLDTAVRKAAQKLARQRALAGEPEPSATLIPATQTVAEASAEAVREPEAETAFRDFPAQPAEPVEPREEEIHADSVFAKLKDLKKDLDEAQ